MAVDEHNEEIKRLRENIRIEVDMCEPIDTPIICANREVPNGYEKIEELILQTILNQFVTIGQAIIIVEKQLNINGYAD